MENGYLRTADGQRIAFSHYRSDETIRGVVILAHGFFSGKDSFLLKRLAERLHGRKDVFLFDFRGHGKSSGYYTWSAREHEDLRAVLEHVSGLYDDISVVGFSLGASISINLISSSEYAVQRLVCVSAVSEVSRIDWRPWRIDWENDVKFSLLSRRGWEGRGARIGPWWFPKPVAREGASRLDMPVLYIHGTSDIVVGDHHSKDLFQRTPGEKELYLVEDGPHAEYLLRGGDVVADKISAWCER